MHQLYLGHSDWSRSLGRVQKDWRGNYGWMLFEFDIIFKNTQGLKPYEVSIKIVVHFTGFAPGLSDLFL